MKLLTLLLAALLLPLTSCSTTTPEGAAFSQSVAQTASYFAATEVLSKAKTPADWQDKKDTITALIVVLQGINGSVTDPVEIRALVARFFAGKPAHWLALSQLIVSWVNLHGTEEGRSATLKAIISGLSSARDGTVSPQ